MNSAMRGFPFYGVGHRSEYNFPRFVLCQAFETKCMRKLLRTSYLDHKTNDWVQSKINFLVDPQERLLATVKRQKLAWFGHVTRHDNLSKTILQGTMEGGRGRGRQRKCWMDNIKK